LGTQQLIRLCPFIDDKKKGKKARDSLQRTKREDMMGAKEAEKEREREEEEEGGISYHRVKVELQCKQTLSRLPRSRACWAMLVATISKSVSRSRCSCTKETASWFVITSHKPG